MGSKTERYICNARARARPVSFRVKGACCFELQLRDLSCSLALLAYSTKIEDNIQVACGNKLQIKFAESLCPHLG